MTKNVGMIDRALRIIVGLVLIYYALFFKDTGYNWLGWIGVIPIFTALVSWCPLYTLLGIRTCQHQ